MIQHTFIHIPGIGPKTEQRLWDQGITTLEELSGMFDIDIEPDCEHGMGLGGRSLSVLEDSLHAFEEQDWHYFCDILPAREHWRLLPCFSNPAFLDIETTGLGFFNNHITVIGIYDGSTTHSYIYGRNLDDFAHDINSFDVLITYNGKTFDLPFIKESLHIDIPLPHIDLRYLLGSLDLKGGLKKIEFDLGIRREGKMRDIDGFMAVLLWNEYVQRGDRSALETLAAYNCEDVVNLAPLSAIAFNRKLPEQFSHLMMPEEVPRPDIPFRINPLLIDRLSGAARF